MTGWRHSGRIVTPAELAALLTAAVGLSGCGSHAARPGRPGAALAVVKPQVGLAGVERAPVTIAVLPVSAVTGVVGAAEGRVIVGAESVVVGPFPAACPVPIPPFHGYLIGGRLGGAFGSPVDFLRQLDELAPAGRGAVALGSTLAPVGEDGTGCGGDTGAAVARVAATGQPDLATALAGPEAGATRVAGDAAGDVGVAWLTPGATYSSTSTAHATIQLVGARTIKRTIASARGDGYSSPGLVGVAVAFDPGHRLLVVDAQRSGVWVRTMMGGGTLGPRQHVADLQRGDAAVSVGEDANGGAVVAWTTASGDMDGTGPTQVFAATRRSAGAPFGRPVRLDAGDPRVESPAGVSVAVGRNGRVALEWLEADRALGTVVRAAVGSTGSGLGRAVLIASGRADGRATVASGVPAVGGHGRAVLDWVSATGQIVAATVPAGAGRPGAAEVLSAPGEVGSNPVGAFDSTGRSFVVWTARTGHADDVAVRLRVVQ